MIKISQSSRFIIRVLSLVCLAMAPLSALAVGLRLSRCAVYVAAMVCACSILLLSPLSDDGSYRGVLASLIMTAVCAVGIFFSLGVRFCVFSAMLVLFAHLLVGCKHRFEHLRTLFNRQAVLVSVENHDRLLNILIFCALCFVAEISVSEQSLNIPSVVLLSVFYLLSFFRQRNGFLIVLSPRRRKALMQLIRGELCSSYPSSEDGDALLQDTPRMQQLYDRAVGIMETSKPFLNKDYSLLDLSRDMYTNKSYVSNAINVISGRNFRQFINYYRVKHSVELIKNSPHLRVEELADMSGFNSTVTYNMAFKLNMQQTPGEFTQEVRAHLR